MVDRESLEQIRTEALTLADQASVALVDAFVGISDVLEPEQRQVLMAFAAKFQASSSLTISHQVCDALRRTPGLHATQHYDESPYLDD